MADPFAPRYLGDGLYASWDGYQVKLMANSHEMPTDVVYLDPHVQVALVRLFEDIANYKGNPNG